MGFKFNPITGNLDLVGNSNGFVKGPPTSTDKAISRWSGTTGDQLQDSQAFVQDGGALQSQAIIVRREIADLVTVQTGYSMLSSNIDVEDGELVIDEDGELVIL